MVNATSVDVLGLVAVTTTIEVDPRADFYGHGPTHAVETLTWLSEADRDLTLGQLLARSGMDEDGQIVIRFATAQEQRVRLAQLVLAPRCLVCDTRLVQGRCPAPVCQPALSDEDAGMAPRDVEGRIVGEPDAEGYEDEDRVGA